MSFGGYESNFEKMDVSVPQGSDLAPLLFLICIYDLQNIIRLKVLDFADGTLLYTTFKKQTYMQDNNNIRNFKMYLIGLW